jgi:hypothetical protein
MNGFTEHLSGASERGAVDRLMTWGESRVMLPLIGRVARDVIRHQQRLGELRPERDRLERRRADLDWPQRQRRYQIEEEILSAEKDMQALVAELSGLGVVLLDAGTGLVGFPTMVNNRPAYFSWRPDEEALSYWNFADDTVRRPIPEDWTNPPGEARGRTKSRK